MTKPELKEIPYAAERLAEAFHTFYESRAHEHDYETRKDSAVPWADVPAKNKLLMLVTCMDVIDWMEMVDWSTTAVNPEIEESKTTASQGG